MFFQDPILPNELVVKTVGYLSKTEQLNLKLACLCLRDAVRVVQWKGAEARSYEDFVSRLMKLPVKFRRLVLLADHYTLPLAEKIVSFLAMSYEERIRFFLQEDKIQNISLSQRKLLMSDNCIIAMEEGLITGAQAFSFGKYLAYLISDDALDILREKLIIVEQVFKMCFHKKLVKYLMSEWGRVALREKLITPECIRSIVRVLGDVKRMQAVLTENGILALRERLITPEALGSMPSVDHINCLLSSDGLRALRLGLVRPEELSVIEKDVVHGEIKRRLDQYSAQKSVSTGIKL